MAPKSDFQFSVKIGTRTLSTQSPGAALNMKSQCNVDWKMIVSRNEKHVKSIGFTTKSMLLQVFEKVENRCRKGCRKSLFFIKT